MALLDDIGNALITAGLVTTGAGDWKLMFGYLHDAPDRAVAIFEAPGGAPEQRWAIDYPDFQIQVRGKENDYPAVRAKLQAIFDLLHAGDVEINTTVSPPSGAFVYVYAVSSGPVPLGSDEKRRPRLAQRYRTMKNRP